MNIKIQMIPLLPPNKNFTDLTRAKLRVQHLASGKNFSFHQWLKQRVLLFSWKSYFIKVIENFSFFFGLHNLKKHIHKRGVGRFSTASIQTLDFFVSVRTLFRILPTPLVFTSGYPNTETEFSIVLAKWVYNLFAREARVLRVLLASRKLERLIFND